ncbi:MAG: potassium channel family protein [Austwickia sp.]|nr:potassium channel family protein [Austwickia sp.]MBK8436245.1 potassium channel family protein [Austwickia sp.]MBK9101923.1 potassium channel family protein [Austwickia sp.]
MDPVEWLMIGFAVAFLVSYAWPILDPGLARFWVGVCEVVQWVVWAAFVVEYLARLAAAPDRGAFVRRRIPELAVILLPMFRSLRLLRLITVLSVLNRNAGDSLRGRVAVYMTGGTATVLCVSGLAVLAEERTNPEANITSYGDALWWALTTMTTVGYGDRYPTTTAGRWVAAGLMVSGIALLGAVTASIASWLVERVREIEEESQGATRGDVRALQREVNALRRELSALRAVDAGTATGDGTATGHGASGAGSPPG